MPKEKKILKGQKDETGHLWPGNFGKCLTTGKHSAVVTEFRDTGKFRRTSGEAEELQREGPLEVGVCCWKVGEGLRLCS